MSPSEERYVHVKDCTQCRIHHTVHQHKCQACMVKHETIKSLKAYVKVLEEKVKTEMGGGFKE